MSIIVRGYLINGQMFLIFLRIFKKRILLNLVGSSFYFQLVIVGSWRISMYQQPKINLSCEEKVCNGLPRLCLYSLALLSFHTEHLHCVGRSKTKHQGQWGKRFDTMDFCKTEPIYEVSIPESDSSNWINPKESQSPATIKYYPTAWGPHLLRTCIMSSICSTQQSTCIESDSVQQIICFTSLCPRSHIPSH